MICCSLKIEQMFDRREKLKMEMSENVSFGELLCGKARDKKDFILFLLFCSERLNKGLPVQEVWSDWLATTGQI